MVTSLTPTQERIEAVRQEQLARLASKARHFQVEREVSGWIVRNPKAPGRIELISNAGECTCQHYGVWGRCKHVAIVETRGHQS